MLIRAAIPDDFNHASASADLLFLFLGERDVDDGIN